MISMGLLVHTGLRKISTKHRAWEAMGSPFRISWENYGPRFFEKFSTSEVTKSHEVTRSHTKSHEVTGVGEAEERI